MHSNILEQIKKTKEDILVQIKPVGENSEHYIDFTKKFEKIIKKISNIVDETDINIQLSAAINEMLANWSSYSLKIRMEINKNNSNENFYLSTKAYLNSLKHDVIRIEYLATIQNENVIIVGRNGAGKSSFASYMKDASTDNIITISAQKHLFLNFNSLSNLSMTSKKDINAIQKDDLNKEAKKGQNSNSYNYKNEKLFTELVVALINDHVEKTITHIENNADSKIPKTDFLILKEIWAKLFPAINLKIDSSRRILEFSQHGNNYSINELSDGEKAALYYILQILFVPENSFVFIDEPETFFNLSVSNRLWDILEGERSDIKFIYISHNVPFISSRKNTDILWIKNFTHPNQWDLTLVQSKNSVLPREITAELMGAEKNVLFVEGDYSSYDYALFTKMFIDTAIVYPVGGHTTVINYTKAYNNADIFNHGTAYGVIDNDLRYKRDIEKLKTEKIFTLPVNEIEMLFFDEELMKKYLRDLSYSTSDIKENINLVKQRFFKKMTDRKSYILETRSKQAVDNYISKQRVTNYKGKKISEMVSDIAQSIETINLSTEINDFEKEFDNALANNNYQSLLVLCSLKKEVSSEMGSLIDPKYMERMLNKFKRDDSYIEHIKNKYFEELSQSITSTQ